MEPSKKRVVIPVDYGWSDVGGWKALYDVLVKDENENVINTDNICLNSSKNLVFSKKFVSLIDVEDLVVVETEDAILISKMDSSEKVKTVVENLQKQNKTSLI